MSGKSAGGLYGQVSLGVLPSNDLVLFTCLACWRPGNWFHFVPGLQVIHSWAGYANSVDSGVSEVFGRFVCPGILVTLDLRCCGIGVLLGLPGPL